MAHMGQNYGYETLMTELPTFMKQILHFDIKSVSRNINVSTIYVNDRSIRDKILVYIKRICYFRMVLFHHFLT